MLGESHLPDDGAELPQPDAVLDLSDSGAEADFTSPLLISVIKSLLGEMQPGQVLEVRARTSTGQVDLAALCRRVGCIRLDVEEEANWIYLFFRKERKATRPSKPSASF